METLVVAGFAHGERTNDGTKSVVGDQRHVESKEPKRRRTMQCHLEGSCLCRTEEFVPYEI